MSTSTITFSAPQIIREYATDRTKKPMYSLSDMQAQYGSLKWSSMSVNVGDGKGTASMNNMMYDVACGSQGGKMNVFINATDKHFVFTSVNTGTKLALIVFKDNNKATEVVIKDLKPLEHYILFVDDNFDVYCTPISLAT